MIRYLFIIFAFISTLSYSQKWEKLSTTEKGEEIFLRPHSKNSAWIKFTNTDVQKNLFDSDKVKGIIMTLYRFDCENLKLGELAKTIYDDKGEVITSDQPDEILVEMLYPIPDSYGEYFLKTFCKSDK